MIDHLRQLKDETDGTITLKPEVAVADHTAVMVYGHATATRNGRQLDIHNAYVWRLRDGKFCEANLIANDQRAEAEFWA
jgi:ketosteroid isomerase-like protein